MKIKRFDVDENGNIVVVYGAEAFYDLLDYCTEETETHNERTRDEIEKFVNNMLSEGRIRTIYGYLKFLRKFKINIDTRQIDVSKIFYVESIFIVYAILTELNAMTKEIKDAIKNKIINYYNNINYIEEIYKFLSEAIENNDKEFVEFLVKDIIGKILYFEGRRIEREFEEFIRERNCKDNHFTYLIRTLELIHKNNLHHLISYEIDCFKTFSLSKTKLMRLLKSKKRDYAITLIKILDDDELKRYLIMSSLNE